ncbi:MAG: ammonium transporter [Syntrophothermus sp.]
MNKLNRILIIFAMLFVIMVIAFPEAVHAQQADPTGNSTGTLKDIPSRTPGSPTLAEVADAVGHSRISLNIVWTLIAAFLVMFMQAGFAMVETGFTRAKNVAHTMGMNFLVYAIGILGFWICGFAFMFGGVGQIASLGGTPGLDNELGFTLFGKTIGLLGASGFFLNNHVYDVGIFTLFLFQMVFMDTTVTIPTGAMAERWRFNSFIITSLFISMFVYPVFGNWVWGGGFLSTLGKNFGLGHGHVDFAGSSVVHMVGGITALAGAMVLGPRIGKYDRRGTPTAIPGHNIPMAMIGTFILAFGWFGFNAGSTLSGNDLRISIVATNTMIASAAGALSSTIYMMFVYGKPDPSMMANGLLAGLVAITAPSAFVNSWASFLIGGIAGILVVLAVFFVDQKLKIDDPVGAVAVHGVNGFWGIIALGLFADGSYGDGWNGVSGTVRGLFYGDASQLLAQITGSIVCILFVFPVMYGFFKLSDKWVPLRVSRRDEAEGLDMPEMGVKGYDDSATQGNRDYSPQFNQSSY